MPAMTMPYPVKDPQGLQAVQPGDKSRRTWWSGRVYWLQHLVITDQSGRGSVPATTAPQELLPGAAVPDVPMIDQDGKTLHLRQFKGKAVLLTFIYTRCPLPNFCPLISSEFAEIHKELKKNSDDLERPIWSASVSIPLTIPRRSCGNTAWHISRTTQPDSNTGTSSPPSRGSRKARGCIWAGILRAE